MDHSSALAALVELGRHLAGPRLLVALALLTTLLALAVALALAGRLE